MFRVGVMLAVFLGLAAWAGAQGPPPLSTADQLNMLRANQGVIEELVDRTVELAGANTPLKRAETCRKTAGTLAGVVGRAAEAQNPDRVAELGDHLEAVLRDGLIPNLEEADRTVTPASPEWARLQEVRKRAVGGLDELRDALPTTGKVGENGKVKDLRDKLDGFKARVKEK